MRSRRISKSQSSDERNDTSNGSSPSLCSTLRSRVIQQVAKSLPDSQIEACLGRNAGAGDRTRSRCANLSLSQESLCRVFSIQSSQFEITTFAVGKARKCSSSVRSLPGNQTSSESRKDTYFP